MGAIISSCKKYRYQLHRKLTGHEIKAGPALFIMLNPSTADAENNDPTIRRCIGFAKSWGCTDLFVCNLFAFRATNPKELLKEKDPIGPENDRLLRQTLHISGYVIAAWGNHGTLFGRDKEVIKLLDTDWLKIRALQLTKKGNPSHPLYLKKNLQPFIWEKE